MLIISVPASAQSWFIAYFKGEAYIHRGDNRENADFDSHLRDGDTVSTGNSSLTILKNTQGSTVKMREQSILRLDSLETNIELRLQKGGGIFSRIVRLLNNTFTVTTPLVSAGVRGTEFFIAYGCIIEERAVVWLCVNEGSVAVQSPEQEVLVHAGEGMNILSGTRITEPRFYPWTRGLNWNSDPERGSLQDTTDLRELYYDLLDSDYD